MALLPEEGLGLLARGITTGMRTYADEKERARQRAREQAKALQGFIDAQTQAGQGQAALALRGPFFSATNEAFGLDLKPSSIAGGALPGGGRDFNNRQTLGAIRGSVGLDRLAPTPAPGRVTLSPGQVLADSLTGKPLLRLPDRPPSGLTYEQQLALAEAKRRFDAQQNDLDRGIRMQGTQDRQAAQSDAAARRAAEDLRRRQSEWDRAAQSFIDKELSAAEARAKAKANEGAAEPMPLPPMPAAPESEKMAYAQRLAAWQARSQNAPAAMGLSQEERLALRQRFLQDFARQRGGRPVENEFIVPGRTAPGPLAPLPR